MHVYLGGNIRHNAKGGKSWKERVKKKEGVGKEGREGILLHANLAKLWKSFFSYY